MTRRSLIVFAKLPRAGEVKTRLGASMGMERAVEIYRQFAEHAFALSDRMAMNGVAIYVFYAPGVDVAEMKAWVGRDFHYLCQEGVTLGERMQNAFRRTFLDGCEQSVIVGTDVPELDAGTIESAFEALTAIDIVLGPSMDGGYYLLGMKPPLKEVFDRIEWSTASVLRQTLNRINILHYSHVLLPEFTDIDTKEDYDAYKVRASRGGAKSRFVDS